MKNPKLKLRKKIKITKMRKFKQSLHDIVDDCLTDIRYYIVEDLLAYLKKEGIIYHEKKNKKKNKKKNSAKKTK